MNGLDALPKERKQ